jgi:hypothetical protein
MFVLQNYHVLNKHDFNIVYDVIDLCLCACFLFHWCVDFILARYRFLKNRKLTISRIWFLFSFNSILDFITITPTLILSIGTISGYNLKGYTFLQLIRILRLFRLFVLFYDINRISMWSSVKCFKLILLIYSHHQEGIHVNFDDCNFNFVIFCNSSSN